MKFVLIVILNLSLFVSMSSAQETKGEEKGHDKHTEHKTEQGHGDHNKSNEHMNKSSFDDLTRAFEDESRAEWQKPDLVIAKLGKLDGKTVADIGSGTGYFSFRLADENASVVAIDVDERFRSFIEQKKSENNVSNLTTRLVGYDNPEVSDGEFDIILIVDTYHHFNDKLEYMGHCIKGLKKGGMLMIVDFKNQSTSHGPPVDHRISAEEVKEDLQKAGFGKVKIDQSTLPEQYIITAKK